MTDSFPSGASALHPDWPEAQFNVSGMFAFEALILGLCALADKGFGCRAPIESIHGAPAVPWNGGRICAFALKPQELDAALSAMYSRNIGCFFTFTNHLLEVGDLGDPACNFLLDRIGRRPDLNGVIVASELLSKYIAGKHPALRQVASITKVTMESGRGNASYYAELGKRFHRYIVHPDDCHDPKLLDQLDRGKAEIIVNENCLRECTLRPRHYELIARAQKVSRHNQAAGGGLAGLAPDPVAQAAAQELEKGTAACPSVPLARQIGRRQRNCNFTRGELKGVYDMGFRHFKLQGRRDNIFGYAYDLTRFTLEPDFAAPLAFKTLCPMIRFTSDGQ